MWDGLGQYKEVYSAKFSFVFHLKMSVKDDQRANTTNSMGLLTCEVLGAMVIWERKKRVFSMPFVDKGDKLLTWCSKLAL